MSKKKYNQKYIEDANKHLWNILNDKKEFDDWTQISLSVQNAVQAAANIWGTSSDEQIHNMAGFIREIALSELANLQRFDITFADKNTAITLQSIEWWHKHNYNNLQSLLKKLVENNDGEVNLQGCMATIQSYNVDEDYEGSCEVEIKHLSSAIDGLVSIQYTLDNNEYEDASDSFSYDELYDILCNVCRTIKS